MTEPQTLAALTEVAAPAWHDIEMQLSDALVSVELVPASQERRVATLTSVQMTVASALGAVIWNCGAILIDHRWIRLLGAGVDGLPGAHLASFERSGEGASQCEVAVVAYDALGGVFVVDGGGISAHPGEVCYWAPDSLAWSPLGFGYSTLISFLLSDRLPLFYEGLRWPGWETDSERLAPDQGIAAYPPPFAEEGRPGERVKRTAASIVEVVAANREFAAALPDDRATSRFRVVLSPGDPSERAARSLRQ